VVVVLLSLASHTFASCCSGKPSSLKESYEQNEVVFSGIVKDIIKRPDVCLIQIISYL
jgi:hypothetical protein